jgi:molybdopterin-synthase adenylyltransferase
MKPRLLSHYRVRFEPPGASGEEKLVFSSERKRVVLRGHSFREFLEDVVPLLDGRHTVEEIRTGVEDVFDPEDLDASLALLSEQHLLEDAEAVGFDPEVERSREPQLNYFRELGEDPVGLHERLAGATVTVVGLGGLGAVAAAALAASGVGCVRCVDGLAVTPVDPFLTQLFDRTDVGSPRVDVIGARIAAINPAARVQPVARELETDDDAAAVVEDSSFVLGCIDPGLAAFTYRLNRACLRRQIPWCSGTVSAFEGIVGPTVIPFETACFLCYQMRAVACRDDPEDAFEDLKDQDRRKRDESSHRENLAFGAGIVGQMLALEAFKALLGMKPASSGRIVTIDFGQLATQTHVVLRKPWCPACFDEPSATAT